MALRSTPEQIAREAKEKKLPPVVYLPDDPENGRISKEDFLKKQRKKKEFEAKMKAYEEKARAEVEADLAEGSSAIRDSSGSVAAPEPEPEPVHEKKKAGRPRKI
jgi:hypothetical protein